VRGKPVKARPKLATLAELRTACRDAPVVWLALCEMAAERGSNYVTPTREKLSERTGIARLKTISAALTALHQAGWIQRKHTPVSAGGQQTATLLSIILRRVPSSGTSDRPYRGRKTPRTYKTHVEREIGPIARGRKTPQESSKEDSVRCVSLCKRPHLGETSETDPPAESRIANIERERLDEIRRRRLAETIPPDYVIARCDHVTG